MEGGTTEKRQAQSKQKKKKEETWGIWGWILSEFLLLQARLIRETHASANCKAISEFHINMSSYKLLHRKNKWLAEAKESTGTELIGSTGARRQWHNMHRWLRKNEGDIRILCSVKISLTCQSKRKVLRGGNHSETVSCTGSSEGNTQEQVWAHRDQTEQRPKGGGGERRNRDEKQGYVPSKWIRRDCPRVCVSPPFKRKACTKKKIKTVWKAVTKPTTSSWGEQEE